MRLLYAALCVVLAAWAAIGAPPQAPPVREKPVQAPPVRDDPTTPAPPGYQWQKVGNEPWKLVAVPGVAAAPTFRNAGFHSGHQCPQCGRTQTTISGFNRDGTHNHTCIYDGTTWRH